MLQLITIEKKALIKGFFICFVIVFPFTFFPLISEEGNLIELIIDRIPWSLLYTAGFSLAVVLSAIYQNYNRQKDKMDLFKTPAFRSLGFELFTSGHNSVFDEFNVYLNGAFDGHHYAIDVEFDQSEKTPENLTIEPILGLKPEARNEFFKRLKDQLKPMFTINRFDDKIIIKIAMTDLNANDSKAITKYLNMISPNLPDVEKMEAFTTPLFEDLE